MNPESKQKRIAFGYMRLVNNQIAIHEGQAAALKLIYAMYAEGKSLAGQTVSSSETDYLSIDAVAATPSATPIISGFNISSALPKDARMDYAYLLKCTRKGGDPNEKAENHICCNFWYPPADGNRHRAVCP